MTLSRKIIQLTLISIGILLILSTIILIIFYIIKKDNNENLNDGYPLMNNDIIYYNSISLSVNSDKLSESSSVS